MPFALIFVGLILVTAGVRQKTGDLYTLVKGDIESSSGQTGYLYWMVAILIIGAVGYIENLKPFSRAFMALVIVILFLKTGNPLGTGGGFFAQFQAGLGSTPASTSDVSIETPLAPARPITINSPINVGGITGNFSGSPGALQDLLNQIQNQ